MTRWTAFFACALTLAIAAPLGQQAEAAYTRKRCIAPSMWGAAQTTWVCTAAERCCYDWLLRRGSCIATSARCF
jgi:hypothetical protein